ncbi:MAG: flippase activity-associated protein Agl23, partial [Thermoanaerobaculia bacterium]
LLAVSPSLVYYGRDFIHETYLVLFTLALVAAGSVWLERRRPAALVLAAASAACLFAVKETAVITLGGLAGALLLVRFPWRTLLAGTSRGTLAGAALAFAGVWVLLFSSFLTDPAGVFSPFRALLLWTEKGVEGAGLTRPWTYFPEILLRFEAVLAAGALLGAGAALRRRDAFGLFCALWTASQLAAYSIIPYKTPWLVLNIVLPAALTAGAFAREVAASPAPALRRGGAVLLALALAATAWRAAEVAFRRYDDPSLLLIYAPTDRDVRRLVAYIKDVSKGAPPDREITIKLLSPHLWPLPWYLRDLGRIVHRPRLDAEPQPDADVLVVADDKEARVRPRLHGTYARRTFRLRPHQPVVVHVNRNVRGASGSDPDRGLDDSPREANVSPGRADRPDRKASLPDLGLDRPDLGANDPDLGPNRPDLRASRPDLGPNRSDLGANHPDLGPGRPDLGANRPPVEASRLSFRREGTKVR